MKWMRHRFLLLSYVILLAVLVLVGCSSKQDQSEILAVCGNHSCGDLVMVTTDTSSDGFHYLSPSLSPDGTRILFSADWWAIPSPPYDREDPGDVAFVTHRQLILLPNQVGVEPATTLAGQGGVLVELFPSAVPYGGGEPGLDNLLTDDKSGPIWADNSHLIFSLRAVEIGNQYRLLRADISDPALAHVEFLYMEPADRFSSPPFAQHLAPQLSADGRWLAFTRSACVRPDSFETCSGVAIWALDMNTAGIDHGYGARVIRVTNEYSRIENPHWSPDGVKLVFSGGLDVGGAGMGSGTEIFTVDFDSTGAALDLNLHRVTYTSRAPGDPISGILNYSPSYSPDGGTIYFVSTRRAPATTLHDRNLWRVPADGRLEPEIYFFTRSDDVDPSVLPDGRIMLSSGLGFPTEMLDRLEEEAYQRIVAGGSGLGEVQMRDEANAERRQLEFFEGVMSHIYIYRP